MTTILSTVVKLRIHKKRESAMSPLYSVELLYGVATQVDSTTGVESPYIGDAVLWIQPPSGSIRNPVVSCASPNGAWKYFNTNDNTGTWTVTIHVPATTGKQPTVSPDYSWEVDSSVATSQ